MVPRRLDGVVDDGDLEMGFFIVDAEAAQGSNDLDGFVASVFGEQPARRFREPERHNENDKREEALEGNGEPGAIQSAISKGGDTVDLPP